KNGVEPQTVKKIVRETVRSYDAVAEVVSQYSAGTKEKADETGGLRLDDIPVVIDKLEKQMKEHARAMEFEKAAEIRDEIGELRKILG
ncbi:UvrB/UvrC motif-containing protein, partial [Acinetobacter baumannii]